MTTAEQTYTQLSLFDTDLDKFMKCYNSTNVTKQDDYLVYKVPKGTADYWAGDANSVIEKLKLDLVAIPSKTYPKDSFIVQSNEIPYGS